MVENYSTVYKLLNIALLSLTILLSVLLILLYFTETAAITQVDTIVHTQFLYYTLTQSTTTLKFTTSTSTITSVTTQTAVVPVPTTTTIISSSVAIITSTSTILTDIIHPPYYTGKFGNFGTSCGSHTLISNTVFGAQRIIIRDRVHLVKVWIYGAKVSGTSGSLRVSIMNDAGGVPGSEIAHIDVDHSSLPGSDNFVLFDFSPGLTLDPGTYYLMVKVVPSTSDINFRWCLTPDNIEGTQLVSSDSGLTWADSMLDAIYLIDGDITP